MPWLASPGRPRKRKIATGRVGWSARATKTVAPNSPSAIAKAKPAATPKARDDERQVDLPPGPGRRGAERRRSLAQPRVDGAKRGRDDADDERRGHERLCDGHEPPGRAEVDRRLVERDEEPEAEHDGRGAEREQNEAVDDAGRPSRERERGEASDDERDRGRGGREDDRVPGRLPRLDEQRGRLLEERAPAPERAPHEDGEREHEHERCHAEHDRRPRAARGRPGGGGRPPRRASVAASPARASRMLATRQHDGRPPRAAGARGRRRPGGRRAAPPGCRSRSRASRVPARRG